MYAMFHLCGEIEHLDLSNFDTTNVLNMSWMFNKCDKLKYLNCLNFSLNNKPDNMFSFKTKKKCEFITNNKQLLQLYNSS